MSTCRVFQTVFSVFLVAVSGRGGGNSGPGPGPDPEPVIETRAVDLFDYVGGSLDYVQAYSEGYPVPTASGLDQFDSLVNSVMNQNLQAAQSVTGNIGFRLLRILDCGGSNND